MKKQPKLVEIPETTQQAVREHIEKLVGLDTDLTWYDGTDDTFYQYSALLYVDEVVELVDENKYVYYDGDAIAFVDKAVITVSRDPEPYDWTDFKTGFASVAYEAGMEVRFEEQYGDLHVWVSDEDLGSRNDDAEHGEIQVDGDLWVLKLGEDLIRVATPKGCFAHFFW